MVTDAGQCYVIQLEMFHRTSNRVFKRLRHDISG